MKPRCCCLLPLLTQPWLSGKRGAFNSSKLPPHLGLQGTCQQAPGELCPVFSKPDLSWVLGELPCSLLGRRDTKVSLYHTSFLSKPLLQRIWRLWVGGFVSVLGRTMAVVAEVGGGSYVQRTDPIAFSLEREVEAASFIWDVSLPRGL